MTTKRCCVCNGTDRDAEMMTVNFIERNTGPSWTLYACVPECARYYGGKPYAPDWLKDDLTERGLWVENG